MSSERGALPAPHNLENERAVLGGMMLDYECAELVTTEVRAEDFFQIGHQVIFTAIVAQMRSVGVIQLHLIADHLRREGRLEEVGGSVYLAGLEQSTLSSAAAPELAQRVREDADLRRVMAIADSALRCASEQRKTAEEILSGMNRQGADVIAGRLAGGVFSDEEAAMEALDEMRRIWSGESTGLSWGLPSLDHELGPIPKGGVVIIGGKTGHGKTTFLLEILRSIGRDGKALLFSLEMNLEELGVKRIARETGVSSRKAMSTGATQFDQHMIEEAVQTGFKTSGMRYDDTPNLTLDKLASRARAFKLRHPDLAVVAVDYLQLIESDARSRRGEDRVREVATFSRGLKLLARELNVPVIALSQFSRKADEKGEKSPKLSFLRECGAIEQDASIVIGLWGADETQGQQQFAIVDVHILKSRMGRSGGKVSISFNKSRGQFEEMNRR